MLINWTIWGKIKRYQEPGRKEGCLQAEMMKYVAWGHSRRNRCHSALKQELHEQLISLCFIPSSLPLPYAPIHPCLSSTSRAFAGLSNPGWELNWHQAPSAPLYASLPHGAGVLLTLWLDGDFPLATGQASWALGRMSAVPQPRLRGVPTLAKGRERGHRRTETKAGSRPPSAAGSTGEQVTTMQPARAGRWAANGLVPPSQLFHSSSFNLSSLFFSILDTQTQKTFFFPSSISVNNTLCLCETTLLAMVLKSARGIIAVSWHLFWRLHLGNFFIHEYLKITIFKSLSNMKCFCISEELHCSTIILYINHFLFWFKFKLWIYTFTSHR